MATAEVSKLKTLKVQRFKPSDNPSNNFLTDEKGLWATSIKPC